MITIIFSFLVNLFRPLYTSTIKNKNIIRKLDIKERINAICHIKGENKLYSITQTTIYKGKISKEQIIKSIEILQDSEPILQCGIERISSKTEDFYFVKYENYKKLLRIEFVENEKDWKKIHYIKANEKNPDIIKKDKEWLLWEVSVLQKENEHEIILST
jgi:hypothetical protein